MKFKKCVIVTMLTILFFSFIPNNFVYAENEDTNEINIEITSPVALLMESETGTVLYEKRAYEKMYPASTTKIMTAILAIESCDLDDVAVVSRDALLRVPSDYTNANLQVGEELTIRDLLYAFMIPSANDCGFVLAEHIAGSVESFADMMNKKAAILGCTNTHFTNPSGIHDENHYSTAYDLALIGRYAMKNEIFREIVSTSNYTLPATNKYENTDRYFVNTNYLIRESKTKYYYEYATGIKTGFTDASRDCVVASAKKDGIEYIAVILYAGYTQDTWLKEKFIDSVTLFNYAFSNYTTKDLGTQGKIIDKIKISGATKDTRMLDIELKDSLNAFVSVENLNKNYEPAIIINPDLKAPISKGDYVGLIIYDVNGTTYSSDLIAGNDVEKINIFPTLFKIFLVICLLYLIMRIIKYTNYRKNRHKNYRKKGKKKVKSYYR